MTESDRDIINTNQLIEILASYYPTDENEKEIAIHSVLRMIDNKATPKDYVIALVDGLKYGNWPWVNYSKQVANFEVKCGVIE